MTANISNDDCGRPLSETNGTSELHSIDAVNASQGVGRPNAAQRENEGRIAFGSHGPFPLARFWSDSRRLRVLGMGRAFPGRAVSTTELLAHIAKRFSVDILRRGALMSYRLKIASRHICRDFEERQEVPRRGHSNPELAAAALREALDEAELKIGDLSYLISHTTSPARLAPPNVSLVVDRLGYEGPYMELRQACAGFANALVIAQGLASAPGVKAVGIVGSETGSIYFDPQRAGEDVSQLVNLLMMGDGAGAIIVGPDDCKPGGRISSNFFGQIGLDQSPGFSLTAGGSDRPFVERGVLEFEHDLRAVRNAGLELFHQGLAAARELGVTVQTVGRIIPHQANGGIAELLGPFLSVEPTRIFVNADRLGNTGSAAIWLALAELRSVLKPRESVLVLGAEATKYMFGGFHYVHA
jgi:3-oxoacyl-[acyl-carrier-protein] synthase-3